MSKTPTVVLFFNDWQVFPHGVNAGGGESSTMALAKEIVGLGYRVVACANLPEGECHAHGIEFWDFGSDYALHEIEKRLRDIGDYYAVCATLVHPLVLIRAHPNRRATVVINHAPSPYASGLEPQTVLQMVDRMLCVSHAQRLLFLGPNPPSDKVTVVRNGFSPEVFSYEGPENRDWNQLMFVGRLEMAKGIHVLLQAFAELKRDYPDLKLSVFGADAAWTEFNSKKEQMMRDLPGLVFHGKVSQQELARHMRTAGLLVFPSVSFETAGLAIVDAQASGCPVVAFGVGGVPEYLKDGILGEVVYERTPQALRQSIAGLLHNRDRLIEYSRNGLTYGRSRTWRVVAEEVLRELHSVDRMQRVVESVRLPEELSPIKNFSEATPDEVFHAHERAVVKDIMSDTALHTVLTECPMQAWPHLIQGIRFEVAGALDQALASYGEAAKHSADNDWQAFFRLAIIHAERGEVPIASRYAQEVLHRAPQFPLRKDLERLVAMAEGV